MEELLPPGLELIVGGVRDPSFGPVVLVGLGGVVAEALADSTMRLAPLSPADGHEMLDELQGRKLLDGFRGGARVDRDEVVAVLQAVGTVLLQHPEIVELDVNPLRATPAGPGRRRCVGRRQRGYMILTGYLIFRPALTGGDGRSGNPVTVQCLERDLIGSPGRRAG